MSRHILSTMLLGAGLCLAFSGCNLTPSTGATATTSLTNSTTKTQYGEVLVSWSASSNSPMEYQIAQSTDGVNYTVVSTVTGSATTAYIAGLTRGTLYYFKIQAVNSSGSSGYSSIVTATP